MRNTHYALFTGFGRVESDNHNALGVVTKSVGCWGNVATHDGNHVKWSVISSGELHVSRNYSLA